MTLVNTITAYSRTHHLFDKGATIVVGLSGGPDSVFLLHYFLHIQQEYGLTLIAAHLNHQWRPEADQEEQFCRELAKRHNVTFVSAKMSDLTSEANFGGSKEAFARNMRRTFLQSVKKQYQADAIALAHHADDQQETFFIRLIRGASLTGLTAMRPKTGPYIRPLLETSKQEILNYLHAHVIAYAIDQSNESSNFLRNRIRASVLPALRACDTRFDANFASTLTRLQETDELLDSITQHTYDTLLVLKEGAQWLNVDSLLQLHPVLQQRVILYWLCQNQVPFTVSEQFLQEIIRFLQSPKGGSHSLHTTWYITKKRKLARIISNS